MAMIPRVIVAVTGVVLAVGCSVDSQPETRQQGLIDPEPFMQRTFALSQCGGSEPISCDVTLRDQCTVDGTQFVDSDYSCLAASIDLDGDEWVQSFTAGSGDITVSATGANDYPFVAVVRDAGGNPDPSQCVSANWYSTRLVAGVDFDQGETLHLIIDHGASADSLAFDISLECDAGPVETACDDGFDNDADHIPDCQDEDCVGQPGCPQCESAAPLELGDLHVFGDNGQPGSSHELDAYNCLPGVDTSSREVIYTYHAAETQDVLFTTNDAANYPLLFVMRDAGNGCTSGECVAANFYSVRFHAEAGSTYYLAVEGVSQEPFSFEASLITPEASEASCSDRLDNDGDSLIDCDDDDCLLSDDCQSTACTATAELDCSTRLLAGNTSAGVGSISQYSCMPALALSTPETAYTFKYSDGPEEQDVLLTLSNETSYALVTAMNDISAVEMDVRIINGSQSSWSQGLLALRPLIAPGRAPRSGPEYYTYSYAMDTCDSSDAHCDGHCDDTGDAEVLAARWGFTLDTDAWTVPALAPGEFADIRIRARTTDEVSFVARVDGSADDVMLMHVPGDVQDVSVPFTDPDGDGLTLLDFEISGFDVNSRSSSDGSGASCRSTCPASSYRCYVAPNNGTTGGIQAAGRHAAGEIQCNPNQCLAGNFYAASFHAKKDTTYFVTVEGYNETDVGYELSVICDPPATERNCEDSIDEDGDQLIDCHDPDCAEACGLAGGCVPEATITCETQLLQGTTFGGTDAIDGYQCALGLEAFGPERTYSFHAEETGLVNFTTSDLTQVVSVAVLEDAGDCDATRCVEANYYGAVAYVEAGKDYHVVVNSMLDDEATPANFSLSVVCDPPLVEMDCDDNVDNDGDRLADLLDPDCTN